MSRIIVRNLPDKITKEKLYELFSKNGTVTDIQLKFTNRGKFRKFAFIGYQKEDQAQVAIDSLNKTFINTSRIQIEYCKGLADPEKPRSWSKHASDSSAYQKKRGQIEENTKEDINIKENTKEKNNNKKRKIKDSKLEQLVSEYKNDNLFLEFVEAEMPDSKKILEIDEVINKEEEVIGSTKLADRSISDLEYLRLKTGKQLPITHENEERNQDDLVKSGEIKKKPKEARNYKLFTVKIKGLPHKLKKSEIKTFLDTKPFTIRKARGIRDVIFAGFKTESGMKKALFKNRSFFDGKRIFVKEWKEFEKVDESEKNENWEKQEERLKNEETVAESGRIFVRNLPYVVTEDDVKKLFEKFGPLSDITLPIDSFTRKPKGFSIITFVMPEHAAKAFSELDGTIFQGRMLHLLPGIDNSSKTEEDNDSSSNYKKNKLIKDKKNAGCRTNWNTFFINENALAAAMAATYNTSKDKVLNDNSNVAVRLALGETQIINQIKEFLEENDVCLDSLNDMGPNCPRSNTVILVKNLVFGTQAEEMRKKFSEFGELKKVVLPPNGVTAIVEFIEPSEAKKAFRKLAYSKFKNVPMYLEWAPKMIFKNNDKETKSIKESSKGVINAGSTESKAQSAEKLSFGADYIPLGEVATEGTTIFVKNLNFTTKEEDLRQHFSKCGKILSVTIAVKKDPKNPGQKLSLGYGFIQYSSKKEADDALKTLQFSKLDDHTLELKMSNRMTRVDPGLSFRNFTSNQGKPNVKILVKNVPFQATQKEVYDLFKVFGEIKSVRLPKKMVGTGSHRGFCFVEYHTIHDAKRAFNALSESTHLFGRRLVLEWASLDDNDVEVLRMKTAERFKPGKRSKTGINVEELVSE